MGLAFDGENHLDPVVQVARHKVCASEINFVISIILKIINAGVSF